MMNKRFEIVIRIITPLLLSLLGVAAISILALYLIHSDHIDKESVKITRTASTAFTTKIRNDIRLFTELASLVRCDPQVSELHQARDREALATHLGPLYQRLHHAFGITHLYLHDPDGRNFLRVHDPVKHSDRITRETFTIAQRSGGVGSGIEFGIHHNLTLRVVVPWEQGGKRLGYIELGEEIDALTPDLKALLGVDLVMMIDKSLVGEKEFGIWRYKSYRNRHYEALAHHYVIDSTLSRLGPALQAQLDDDGELNRIEHDSQGNHYHLGTLPLIDAAGKRVGKIMLVQNLNAAYAYLYDLLAKITGIIALLLLPMALYYARFLRRTEARLNRAYERIRELSITDGLTGLYNKRHFSENGALQLRRATREGRFLSILVADVDHFKQYNDVYGHPSGDTVLQAVATIMQQMFTRAADVCYRVGGEEFAVVLEHTERDEALQMAQKFCKTVETTCMEHRGNPPCGCVTISIGVCTEGPPHAAQLEELYRRADKALYHAKQTGRNNVVLYGASPPPVSIPKLP